MPSLSNRILPTYSFKIEAARQPIQSTLITARLAQSVERKALNLVVVGSSPTVGVSLSPLFQNIYIGTAVGV